MPIDPTLIGRMLPPPTPLAPPPDLLKTAQTASTIEDVRAQVEQRRLAADAARQKAAEDAAVRQALTETGGDLKAALPKLYQVAPTRAAAIQKEWEAAMKDHVEAVGKELDQRKTRLATAIQIGQMANDQNWPVVRPLMTSMSADLENVLPQDYNKGQMDSLIQSGLTTNELLTQQREAVKLFTDGKPRESFYTALASVDPAAPDATAQWNQRLKTYAALPGVPPDMIASAGEFSPENHARAVREAIGPTKLAEQQIQRDTQAQTAAHQTVAEAQRDTEIELARQRVALERQRLAQSAGDVTALSPEGLDAAATLFAKTGQLPALGMGDKNTRKQIINRAAAMIPGLDIASAKADYGANKDSLQAMQKQRDAIGAFEQTAKKNIDIFLAQAGKVVDTGSPLANGLVRQISGRMLGSPDQAAYDAARQVAVNEIAKITSNPTLSGTLSDSARHEIEAFNPSTATLKQTVAVMRLLKQDMANRTGSLDDAMAGIRARISKGAPGSTTPTTTLPPTGRFNPATGKVD